jgi:hypothetical protein
MVRMVHRETRRGRVRKIMDGESGTKGDKVRKGEKAMTVRGVQRGARMLFNEVYVKNRRLLKTGFFTV